MTQRTTFLTILMLFSLLGYSQCPTPVLVPNSGNSLCEGSNLALTTSISLPSNCKIQNSSGATPYSWERLNGLIVPTTTNQTTIPTAVADNYRVRVEIADNGSGLCPCVGLSGYSNVITVNTVPNTPTTIQQVACPGGTATLTAQSTTPIINSHVFKWYDALNGGNLVFTGNPLIVNIPANATGSIHYYVAEELGNCESDRADALIVNTGTPSSPNLVLSSFNICKGSNVTLQVNSGTNIGSVYNWYADANRTQLVGVGTQFTTPAIWQNSQAYWVTEVNAAGCESQPTMANITTYSLVAPTAPNAHTCPNYSATLTANSNNPSVSSSFYWYNSSDTSNLLFIGNPYITPNLSVGGTYYVREVAGGCQSQLTPIVVTVNNNGISNPVSISSNQICAGKSALVQIDTTGGGDFYWYNNSQANNLLHIGSTFNTPLLSSSVTYYVKRVVGNCESILSTIPVFVITAPNKPILNNYIPICEGEILSLNASATNISQFVWSGPNALNISQNTGNLNVTSYASESNHQGWYSVYVVNANACKSDTAAIYVDIKARPSTPSLNVAPVCANENLTIKTDSVPFASYVWKKPTSSVKDTTNVPHLSITNVTTLSSGNYTAYIVVNGCNSLVANIDAIVKPLPVLGNIQGLDSFCIGSEIALTATSVPNGFYYWSGPNGFTANTQQISMNNATVLQNGIYKVKATLNGCVSNEQQKEIFVNVLTSPTFPIDSPFVCKGTRALIYLNNTANNDIFWWNAANDGELLFVGNSFETPKIAQNTTFWAEARKGDCMSNRVATTIYTYALPSKPTPTSNSPICEQSTIQLNDATANVTWSWTGPNGFTSTDQNPTISNASIALHQGTYNLVVADENTKCESEAASIFVKANPLPIIGLPQNLEAVENESLQMMVSGGNIYSWSPVTYLSDASIFNPIFLAPAESNTFPFTQTYTVNVTDAATNCSVGGTTTVTVTGKSEVIIYNTFTPNNDGINDTWVIDFDNVWGEDYVIRVIDRNGVVVFTHDNGRYNDDWAGTYKNGINEGKRLPEGSYAYIITKTKEKDSKVLAYGTLNILLDLNIIK